MKNNKLNKKELRNFTTLVYDYLNKTYMDDLERSIDPWDAEGHGWRTGSLNDLQDFAQLCAIAGRLNDPSCAYAPYLKSDLFHGSYDYDSVALHHENLPDGMWNDFFDVLLKVEEEDAVSEWGANNVCDNFIVEFLNEENLRWWIEDNISREEYKNYKAVYDAGMEEILVEPATGFLHTILCNWLGAEKFNELKTSL